MRRRRPQESNTILSLCDYSGVWSQPYREAGYDVVMVDEKYGRDVRLFEHPGEVRGVLAAPPCTHFAGSGARWWKGKPESELLDGLSIVDACLRIISVCQPAWWVLENPVGRLGKWLGPHRFSFNPYEFAGYADDPDSEAYSKRTLLWGRFYIPKKNKAPNNGTYPAFKSVGGKSDRTKEVRSKTPQGFARAFFNSNP